MNEEQAVQLLIAFAYKAQSAGVLTMQESALGLQAIQKMQNAFQSAKKEAKLSNKGDLAKELEDSLKEK